MICYRQGLWSGIATTLMIAVVLAATPARAQLMHLDPLPFTTPADSTSRLALVVDVDRFADGKFDWSLNRMLLTVVLPAGDAGTFFLRLPYLTFDSGEIPLGSRWPWSLGPEAVDGWPAEKRISSFGKMEIGAVGPLRLPWLNQVDSGVALGLPTGVDELYPFSSTSIPFRLQVRKSLVLGEKLRAGLLVGYLIHMGSGKDLLADTAFPSGYQLGATLAGYGRPGARWQLAWDYRNEDGRRSQLVGVQGWLPWTRDGAVGLKVSREIQGSLDRPAEWYFTVSWRLDSFRYRPGAEESDE